MAARVALAAAAIAVLAVVVVVLRRVPAPPLAPSVAESAQVVRATAPVARAADAPTVRSHPTTRAPVTAIDARLAAAQAVVVHGSLRGAAPDGALTLDSDGRLRVDRALRRRFDWYLSLVGELTLPSIRQLVEADAERELGLVHAAEVLAVFDRYVAYLEAETRLDDAPSLDARLATLHALRRAHLGDVVAEAFYGYEERYAETTLVRLAARGNDTMFERHESSPSEFAQRRETETALLSAEHEAQLDAFGADVRQRDAERTALWGPEAAHRLAALDAANADWVRRIAAYRVASATIRNDARLGPAERTRALAALRERDFDPNERRRVEALEAIGRLGDVGTP